MWAWDVECLVAAGFRGRFLRLFFFFFNDTATTEIYTLSLHDALPILVGTKGSYDEGMACLAAPIVLKGVRSEERFSRNAETDIVCRLLLEKKKNKKYTPLFLHQSYTTRQPNTRQLVLLRRSISVCAIVATMFMVISIFLLWLFIFF